MITSSVRLSEKQSECMHNWAYYIKMDDISLKTAAHHLVDFSENQHFSPKLGPETTLPWKKKDTHQDCSDSRCQRMWCCNEYC